jgi:hypothetical protein
LKQQQRRIPDEPISGFDRKFLVDEFTALGKDEVASFRVISIRSTERTDEDALRIRKQRVREIPLFEGET